MMRPRLGFESGSAIMAGPPYDFDWHHFLPRTTNKYALVIHGNATSLNS